MFIKYFMDVIKEVIMFVIVMDLMVVFVYCLLIWWIIIMCKFMKDVRCV